MAEDRSGNVLPDDDLLMLAGEGDVEAMQELSRRNNSAYRNAFRQACIDVLGEDPDEWGAE